MPYTPPIPAIDYYENEELHGNYQYTTLENIVNDYMASLHPDDYSSMVERRLVILNAKRGLRELYYDVVQEIKAVELELSPMLTVTVPPDFVNFVRVSWVDERGLLHPMTVDSRMSMATAYLQDNNFELLFDDSGEVLQGNGVRDEVGKHEEEDNKDRWRRCYKVFNPNVNLSAMFNNGRYRFDKATGTLIFGSEVNGKNIVIEYISDGLYTGAEGLPEAEIKIHKFAEMALINYITKELTKNRRNVPLYQIKESKKEYENSKRIAKRRINALRKNDLLQAFRGVSRWVKS